MEYIYFKDRADTVGKLFPNQRENANALYVKDRALLTDKVGSGKTMSILSAFAALKEQGKVRNLFVLTPLSAYEKKVWALDIDKFMNLSYVDFEEFFLEYDTQPTEEHLSEMLLKYDVIYAKHTHVKNEFYANVLHLIFTRCDVIVCCDEVHAFRNPKTEMTVKFLECLKGNRYFWGITGTPLSKDIQDTYNIVNLIFPNFFGNFWEFRKKYCRLAEQVVGRKPDGSLKKVQKIVGIKDVDMLKEALKPILVQGESFVNLKYTYVDYALSEKEMELYMKIAHGINIVSQDVDDEDWIKTVLSTENVIPDTKIKNVDKYSSRFIYLQSAADGTLNDDGTQGKSHSTKIDLLIKLLKWKIGLGQSVLVYCDYYVAIDSIRERIEEENIDCVLLESSGKSTLTNEDFNEEMVKKKPHIVLCSKASAESASYYFVNNTVFFQIPTVPHTFAQFNGRITRRNTLFPNDLNCYIFRSNNIDLYKMYLVSSKAFQMEAVSGREANIPDDYKQKCSDYDKLKLAKKVMLWHK